MCTQRRHVLSPFSLVVALLSCSCRPSTGFLSVQAASYRTTRQHHHLAFGRRNSNTRIDNNNNNKRKKPVNTLTCLFSKPSASPPDYNELPPDFPRRRDVLVALEAVRRACRVTIALQPNENGIATVSKGDLSPVTVADFAAQAVVLGHLHREFPHDSFIAEESRAPLDEDPHLAQLVWQATRHSTNDNAHDDDDDNETKNDALHLETLKRDIHLGKEYETWGVTQERPPRVWCSDPIDGTKGFLRGQRQGGQYCVALALLHEGHPVIGILGCPNLPADDEDNLEWQDQETANDRGCIFVASRGGGCFQLPLTPDSAPIQSLRVTNPMDQSHQEIQTPAQGRFTLGVEKFSDPMGTTLKMAQIIHGDEALNKNGDIVKARRLDSQAKYGIIARSGAEYYSRLPRPGYREWIWDHAAGQVVLTEAGGQMTDTSGQEIDFSLGAQMSETVHGVLGSNGGAFHQSLVDAYQKATTSQEN